MRNISLATCQHPVIALPTTRWHSSLVCENRYYGQPLVALLGTADCIGNVIEMQIRPTLRVRILLFCNHDPLSLGDGRLCLTHLCK